MTTAAIEEAYDRIRRDQPTEEHRPILWIEELDATALTEIKLEWLRELIDAVIERGGLIICTTNSTLEKLQMRLGDPVFWRISDVERLPDEYLVIDWHKYQRRKTER